MDAKQEWFRSVALGAVLAVVVGWVLHVGKPVFVPIVFSVLIAYVITGLARLLEQVPKVGPYLPLPVRYFFSISVIGMAMAAGVSLIITNVGRVVALTPVYQESLLSKIHQVMVYFGIERAPTWTTLRDDFLGQINIQGLVGSTVVSATAMVTTLLIVFLYVTFLLLEKRFFPDKLQRLSKNPKAAERIQRVLADINARIGAYLAMKTFINVILGVVSWAILTLMGVEFAAFWAVVIAVLNYVPYIGSALGVLFPVAMSIVQFNDLTTVLTLLAALSAAQFVIGNFLDPYLLGNQLNLSPFVILASLAIWSSLWGIPGAFLAVPITAVLVIILSGFSGTRPIAVLLSRNGIVGEEPNEAAGNR
ncbi:MAG: AI-2E family transporter [Burkholderiales bacterium]